MIFLWKSGRYLTVTTTTTGKTQSSKLVKLEFTLRSVTHVLNYGHCSYTKIRLPISTDAEPNIS